MRAPKIHIHTASSPGPGYYTGYAWLTWHEPPMLETRAGFHEVAEAKTPSAARKKALGKLAHKIKSQRNALDDCMRAVSAKERSKRGY